MAALDPPPCLMSGFAEDALLAGTVTRPHEDIDWIFPRTELDLRLEQAAELGFHAFETWGEAAPDVPFYMYGRNGDLNLDLGITDGANGGIVLKVHKLGFEVDGKEAPAGYRVHLPAAMCDHPLVSLDGVAIRPASPLARYQIRVGIAKQGSFRPLSERQLGSMAKLRAAFFLELSERELEPVVERPA